MASALSALNNNRKRAGNKYKERDVWRQARQTFESAVCLNLG